MSQLGTQGVGISSWVGAQGVRGTHEHPHTPNSHTQAVDFTELRVGQGKSCQTISEELVNEALALGSTDNITALVITLKPPKPRPAPSS